MKGKNDFIQSNVESKCNVVNCASHDTNGSHTLYYFSAHFIITGWRLLHSSLQERYIHCAFVLFLIRERNENKWKKKAAPNQKRFHLMLGIEPSQKIRNSRMCMGMCMNHDAMSMYDIGGRKHEPIPKRSCARMITKFKWKYLLLSRSNEKPFDSLSGTFISSCQTLMRTEAEQIVN